MAKIRPSSQLGQDGAASGNVLGWDGSRWAPSDLSGTYASLPAAAERVYYVSKSAGAADANNGRSWGSAFATIAHALAALGTDYGVIRLGFGTFAETVTLANPGQHLDGLGPYATELYLNADGTLLSFTSTNCSVRNLSAKLGAGATTATAVEFNGAFTNRCPNVSVLGPGDGTNHAGLTGVSFTGNAGDNHLVSYLVNGFGVGVSVGSEINYLTGGTIGYNITGLKGLGPGATGVVCKSTSFTGPGTTYVDTGTSSGTWDIDDAWLDGGATNGVIVGSGASGPRLFRLSARNLAATTTNLTINAGTVQLDGIAFAAPGVFTPTDIVINGGGGWARALIPSSGSDISKTVWTSNYDVSAATFTLRANEARAQATHPVVAGYWIGCDATAYADQAMSNNASHAVRKDLPTGTINGIGVNVTVAGTAGALIRLAIYDEVAGKPGNLILDAGTVAGDSTGFKSIVVSQAIKAGTYWLVVGAQSAGGGAPTASGQTPAADVGNPAGASACTGLGNGFYSVTSMSGAYPATYTVDGQITTGVRPVVKFA